MDEFSHEDVNQLFRRFEEILRSKGINDPEILSLTKKIKEAQKDQLDIVNRLNKSGKSAVKLQQEAVAKLDKLRDKLAAGTISLEEFTEQSNDTAQELGYLRKHLIGNAKVAADKAIQDVKNIELSKKMHADLFESAKNLSIGLASTVLNSAKTILTTIQSGASGARIASSIMTAEWEAIGQLGTGIAGMITTTGGAVSMMGGGAKYAGIALMNLGTFAGGTAKVLTEFEKFKIQFLTQEIENATKNFQSMSNSGVVFGGGMETLKSQASLAGLSMTTLANISVKNSEQLAQSGLGVTGGFNKLVKVLNTGGDTFKNNLLNLGVTLEQQGEYVAQVMADMRRAGADLNKVSNSEITEATQEYAKNLKLIAGITGKDAKAKMQQARDDMNMAAIKNMTAKMAPKEAENFRTALAALPKDLRGGMLQALTNHPVADKKTSVLLNQVPELKPLFYQMVDAIKHGDKTEALKLRGDMAKAMNSIQARDDNILQTLNNVELMSATGGGFAGEMSKVVTSFNDELAAGVQSREDAEGQVKQVNDAIKNPGEIIGDINRIILAGEQTRVELENVAITHLKGFVNDAIAAVNLAKHILEESKGKVPTSIIANIGTALGVLWAGSVAKSLFVGKKGAEAVKAGTAVAEGTATGTAKGGLKGFIKGGVKGGGAIGVALEGINVYQNENDETLTRRQKNVKHAGSAGAALGTIGGTMAGASAGVATGAMIGSFIPVPVLGTLIGGLVGGAVGLGMAYLGSEGGRLVGEKMGDAFIDEEESIKTGASSPSESLAKAAADESSQRQAFSAVDIEKNFGNVATSVTGLMGPLQSINTNTAESKTSLAGIRQEVATFNDSFRQSITKEKESADKSKNSDDVAKKSVVASEKTMESMVASMNKMVELMIAQSEKYDTQIELFESLLDTAKGQHRAANKMLRSI